MHDSEPVFPLRIIFDDGEVIIVEEPDDLMDHFISFDSTDAANRVWVRDELGRTIRLRIAFGTVEEIAAEQTR